MTICVKLDFDKQTNDVWLTGIVETFPQVFWFRKSRIKENGGNIPFEIFEMTLSPVSSPVVSFEFWRDVTRKAYWENSPGTPRQIQNGGARPRAQLRPRKGKYISLLPSTMILKCSEGMCVTYSYEIFPHSSQQKAGFRRAMPGTFSRWPGIFLSFCTRPSR